ncbi:MAG TPA: NF038122 family metalloprotease [Candidatus Limnocylindrales bacterium]|nr:NF038122 family metalloprotease [Candidatus Limnocylindrales bacterium]
MQKRAKLLMLLAIVIYSGTAVAGPIVNAIYDPGVPFSAADQAVIQSALNFYTSNMTSTFTVTVAFGAQPDGGGGSQWFTQTSTYNAYYNALVANSSGNATDTSAIASLGGGAHTFNPVTGSGSIVMTATLASALGMGAQVSDVFANCGGLTANACITLSSAALNTGGSPLAGLSGIVQHEFNEVLGTASNLPNGGGSVPGDPLAADLYRYAAPGVRSFALNTSTAVPCSGSPTAYLSVNGGATNLNNYNNCNNGGDYGDWIGTDGLQVQDAFGPDSQAASLNLASPEVMLLDGVGYNFGAPASAPEPSTLVVMLAGLAAVPLLRRR